MKCRNSLLCFLVSRFAPDIYLRKSVSDALSAGSLSALSSTLSSTNTSPPGTVKHGKLTRIPTKDEILKELEIQVKIDKNRKFDEFICKIVNFVKILENSIKY